MPGAIYNDTSNIWVSDILCFCPLLWHKFACDWVVVWMEHIESNCRTNASSLIPGKAEYCKWLPQFDSLCTPVIASSWFVGTHDFAKWRWCIQGSTCNEPGSVLVIDPLQEHDVQWGLLQAMVEAWQLFIEQAWFPSVEIKFCMIWYRKISLIQFHYC